MNLSVIVQNHFGQLAAAAVQQVEKAVRKAAFDIEREAKILAPVDTGFLRASIYVVTKGGSGFKVSATVASGRVQRSLFTGLSVTDRFEAIVAVGAYYGIFLEFGSRRGRAQPYLVPATMKVKASFERDMVKALEGK